MEQTEKKPVEYAARLSALIDADVRRRLEKYVSENNGKDSVGRLSMGMVANRALREFLDRAEKKTKKARQ
jgi:hypothetical protein